MKKSEAIQTIDLENLNEDKIYEISESDFSVGMSGKHFLRLVLCWKMSRNKLCFRYLAPLHVLYIIFAGFFYATIFFVLELSNPETNFPYVDALYISFTNVCVSGFLNHSLEHIRVPSQICLFFAMLSGCCFVTMIPITLVKFLGSRRLMLSKRLEQENPLSEQGVLTDTLEVVSDEGILKRILKKFSFCCKKSELSDYDYYKVSDIEYYSIIWINIVSYIFIIFTVICGFLILGIVFSVNYNSDYKYLKGKNPLWMGLFISVSAFVNCGSTLLDEGLTNFVSDPIVCLTIAFLIMLGNVLLPMTLRYIFLIIYKLSSKRRIVFKYILEKHHHLSPFMYPGIQTSIYGVVTLFLMLVAFVITLSVDHSSPAMIDKGIGVKILISFFHPVSARNGGFASIDLVTLSFPTLIVYTFLMYVKPQMACSLREKAYKIVDMVRYLHKKEEQPTTNAQELKTLSERSQSKPQFTSSSSLLSMSVVNEHGKDETLVKIETNNQDQPGIQKLLAEEQKVYGFSLPISDSERIPYVPSKFKSIIARGFTKFGKILLRSISDFWFYLSTMLSTSNMWMILFIFSISIAETDKLTQQPDKFSLFKILFEVVSAFSNTGFSLGMTGSLLSFSAYFTPFSKILICIVMILGRHRGFYGTLIDMEQASYSQNFTQHVNYMQRRDFLKQYKKQIKSLYKKSSKLSD